jgi:tyrosyl-tRNA synthetase
MGGDDQWNNILGGADLIRRKEQKSAYALTTALLTTSDGRRWQDRKGRDLAQQGKMQRVRFLSILAQRRRPGRGNLPFAAHVPPMDEVRRLGSLPGEEINEAKRVLAYTLTTQVHGEEEASKAQAAAEALFAGGADQSHIRPASCPRTRLRRAGCAFRTCWSFRSSRPARATRAG